LAYGTAVVVRPAASSSGPPTVQPTPKTAMIEALKYGGGQGNEAIIQVLQMQQEREKQSLLKKLSDPNVENLLNQRGGSKEAWAGGLGKKESSSSKAFAEAINGWGSGIGGDNGRSGGWNNSGKNMPPQNFGVNSGNPKFSVGGKNMTGIGGNQGGKKTSNSTFGNFDLSALRGALGPNFPGYKNGQGQHGDQYTDYDGGGGEYYDGQGGDGGDYANTEAGWGEEQSEWGGGGGKLTTTSIPMSV
jgi:hypothetical protein